ncbi:MAG: tRNA guanosine(15) transglycosylase TgtA [Halorhabdus sp.]
MRDHFELRTYDAAGRLGELAVPRAGVTVETPTLLPVINPHHETIDPGRLDAEFGAEMLITNSYVIYGSEEVRRPALENGLHDLLDFSGAIMTDSGSFQLAEYGEIDVTNEEILRFQRDIGTDIGTPIDIPTPPDVNRDRATEELATTQRRLEAAADLDLDAMLVNAPVQGSTYPDLREQAAEGAYQTGLDVFPIGAMVPLMNDYRYGDMIDAVTAAKRGLGEDAPVHLFGAGHPMMFALAVAAGCDLFDSAAYALYARDDRYLTVRGTRHLDDLKYFPCECPVCTAHEPDDLRSMSAENRTECLAEHNLFVSFGEMRRIKQAIRRGNLLELVESRARAHPAVLDGYRALLDHVEQLEATDPASKDAFFYLSGESADRPEIYRHHERLARCSPPSNILLRSPGASADGSAYDAVWPIVPPFGPIPEGIDQTYPVTAEVPERLDDRAYRAAARGIARLVETSDATITLAHDGWPTRGLAHVPDATTVLDAEDKER